MNRFRAAALAVVMLYGGAEAVVSILDWLGYWTNHHYSPRESRRVRTGSEG